MISQASANPLPDPMDIPHVWACHIEGFRFTYLYGTPRECDRLREQLGSSLLRKGTAPSREGARQQAEAAARATAAFYADLSGTVQVVSMAAFETVAKRKWP